MTAINGDPKGQKEPLNVHFTREMDSVDVKTWTLYLLECRSGAYYAGITNNMEARYAAHSSGNGAKFTRSNPPVKILATASFADRSSASKAEYLLKKLPRSQKVESMKLLFASQS